MKFHLGTLLFITLKLTYVLSRRCSNPHQRKEIRELTSDEFERYVRATKALHAKPSIFPGLSQFEDFAKFHNENVSNAHATPKFLAWHRRFLREYELALQKIDPEVHMIYWDWSRDHSDPKSSPILTNSYMGGNGDFSTDEYCVKTGKFANMQLNYPAPHCLQRHYTNHTTMPPFAAPTLLNAYLNFNVFSEFEINLEDRHGEVHIFIGGKYDFGIMTSPNDPLFMLHHAFLDLIWLEWQRRHPNAIQHEGSAYNVTASLSDQLLPWPENVASTFDTEDEFYCYTYPRYNGSASISNLSHSHVKANSATSRLSQMISNLDPNQAIALMEAKMPMNAFESGKRAAEEYQMPSNKVEWIKMVGLDFKKVLANERRDSRFMELLNSLSAI